MELKDTVLGIELGSTRIKAVLVDRNFRPLVSGSFAWENQLVDGVWTYAMDQVYQGLRTCYADLKRQVQQRFGQTIRQVGAIGISGMMHGYLPFDAQGNQLAQFRTWRNTMTGQAAEELTALFGFNIPQRWSIAHLYQAMLNGEPHVKDISFLTTLAGFLHWKLTGEKRMGVGEASGMFPIGRGSCAYDKEMVHKFDALAAEMGYSWTLEQILPQPVPAGTPAGILTPEGAALLDPSGDLQPGIPLAPCEGDAGTGMTATNAVRLGTGNVSAGTSDFAMLVTDCKMAVHREIDMVTTPAGIPVAMVHCNNCTSDINAWVSLFEEFAEAIGAPQEPGKLYTLLFRKALEGSPDGGGLVSCNFYSGEPVLGLNQGRPLVARSPDSRLNLGNFMRTHLLSALATLKIGLDILTQQEKVELTKLYAHGGFFKTPEVGQRILSAATGTPVAVMETAGEGGPYGMALLCGYLLWHRSGETLEDFLENKVFSEAEVHTVMAEQREIEGFAAFLARYRQALEIERTAVAVLPD